MLPLKIKSIGFLLILALLFIPSFVYSHSADPSALMSNYSLYGKDSLIIEEHTITSNTGWVGTDNLFKIIGNWAEEFGSIVKVGNAFNGGGGTATYHDTVYVKGTLTGGLPPSNLLFNPASFPNPEFPNYTADSINVDPSNDVIIENSTVELDPDSYGTINIGANNSNASIGVFKEGVYEVDSLIIWGSLQVDKDSSAYCRILVKSYFSIGSSSQNNHIVVQNGSYGRVLIHVAGEGNLNINPHSRIDATLLAPKVDVKINSDVTLNGQLLAKSITTGQDFNGNTGEFTSFVTTGISINNTSFSEDPVDMSPATEPADEIRSRAVSLGVTLADISDSGGTVDYKIIGGSAAIGSDFDTLGSLGASGGSGTLVFQPNSKSPDNDIKIWLYDDTWNDSVETFTVELSNPSEYIHLAGNLTSSSWTISLINEDSLKNDTIIDTTTHAINAVDDNIIVKKGGTATTLTSGSTSLLANDNTTDPALKLTKIVSEPNYGTLTWDSSGTFVYVHGNANALTDNFIYEVTDAYGSIDSATVTITVETDSIVDTIIHSLTAVSDIILVQEEDTATQLFNGVKSVLQNDKSTDMPITVSGVVTQPQNGTLTLNSDGTFIYIHTKAGTTEDSFVYEATDNWGNKDSATVSIMVQKVNKYTPIALNDTILVKESESADTLITGDTTVLYNDHDSDVVDSNLTANVVTGVSHGTLIFKSNGTFLYTHNGSEFTSDSFTYAVTDKAGHKDTATVTIIIQAVNDHNPIAVDDVIFVQPGEVVAVVANGDSSLLDNDIDLDQGDTLSIKAITDITFGTLFLDSTNGMFILMLSDTCTDSLYTFDYEITDLSGFKDTATVFVTTISVGDKNKPNALDDSIVVDEGGTATALSNDSLSVLDNDIDLDTIDMLTATLLDTTTYGSIKLNKNGTFTYTHDGSENFTDSFTYIVTDIAGQSDTATVHITINSVNDNAPIANPEELVVFKGETVEVTTNGDTTVLANDTDADLNGMDNIKVVLVSDVSNGTLVLDSVTGEFSYTHNGTETYIDSFSYMLNDGVQDGNVVTVGITILDDDIENSAISSAYYDGDGDGIVDTVIINLALPVSASSLSLNVQWKDEGKSGSTVNVTTNPNILTQVIADISGAFSETLNNKTSGTLIANLLIGSDSVTTVPKDSAAPVITFAHLTYGADETVNDTLIAKFSEDMGYISASDPLTFYTAEGDDYSMMLSIIERISKKEFKFEVVTIDAGFTPSSLDSVNINYQASVEDSNGIIQSIPLNQKVKLSIKLQPVDIIVKTIIADTIPDVLIPDDLKGNNDFKIGTVVILDPETSDNLDAIADNLLESSSFKAIIFDVVGNIIAEGDGINESDDDLALNVITVNGKKKVAVNWTNKNLKGRKVGGGTYLMIVQMKGEENRDYKAFVRVKTK